MARSKKPHKQAPHQRKHESNVALLEKPADRRLIPNIQLNGKCVECGKDVAPGQTYVCKDHIRH